MAEETPGQSPAPSSQPSLIAAPGEAPAPVTAGTPPEPPKDGAPAAIQPPAEPEKKEEAAPAAFAPDKLTLPEDMKTDDPLFQKFGGLMTDDKLDPQARGQALLDLYTDAVKTAREAGTDAWNNVNKEWQTQTMADPEIGGAKFGAAKATIAKAIDTLPADLAAGFRQALDITGAGNHPAVVKALHAFALARTEPGHVGGQPPGAPERPSVKDAFYPNSPDMK